MNRSIRASTHDATALLAWADYTHAEEYTDCPRMWEDVIDADVARVIVAMGNSCEDTGEGHGG